MQYEQTLWRLKQIYCPNCRHLVNGYESKDGTTRMTCEKCGSVMIRKTMGADMIVSTSMHHGDKSAFDN